MGAKMTSNLTELMKATLELARETRVLAKRLEKALEDIELLQSEARGDKRIIDRLEQRIDGLERTAQRKPFRFD
jgi:uncharacterized protein Yka (UPF0111/DUF47 family)